jgi:hypothetical protein
MYSIFHFYKDLSNKKAQFATVSDLEKFPFDDNLFSCRNAGQFPDLAIKINTQSPTIFTGGELIELKDSKSYTVSSFNSTIPSGKKQIEKIIKGEKSSIKIQMEKAGDKVTSLLIRDVFYLIRGKNKDEMKVVLVHGSFFETVKTDSLISQSFEKVLEERLKARGLDVHQDIKTLLLDIFSEQESFSKVRNIDKASVKLRFRVMTEVKAEGNILNTNKYPEIKPNTLNLLVPCHDDIDEQTALNKFKMVFSNVRECSIFKVKHHLNGYFLVFQQPI